MKFKWVSKVKISNMLINYCNIYHQGFDTKTRFHIYRELALKMGCLTETNELRQLGQNPRVINGGDISDFTEKTNQVEGQPYFQKRIHWYGMDSQKGTCVLEHGRGEPAYEHGV